MPFSIVSLADPVGFCANWLAVAQALGIETPAQRKALKKTLAAIEGVHSAVQNVEQTVISRTEQIRNTITTVAVDNIQQKLSGKTSLSAPQLITLIRLLLFVKEHAANVVIALIVRYRIGKKTATLGFAALSADSVVETVLKIDRFRRSLAAVEKFQKTCYVHTRIRGKFKSGVENICNAALTTIAVEICGLPREIELRDVTQCDLHALEKARTVVLLHPADLGKPRSEYDILSRTFLIGDTRTGKSTLGNALLNSDGFAVSKGTTGTLRIQRGELVKRVNNEVHVTEIYDTPGLNDKDGLDILYEAAIEDNIRTLQRANTLIMTISADGGLNNSMSRALQTYRSLFGECTPGMLLIVLTLNEPADAEELQAARDLNWPNLCALDKSLLKKNVFCVSTHDLRECRGTESHRTVAEISRKSRGMPMRIIDSLRKRYEEVEHSLRTKAADVTLQLQKLADDGWMAYDELTAQYEGSPYVKMTTEMLQGFVMKHTDGWKKMLAVCTLGSINLIRKVAVHVRTTNARASAVWQKFQTESNGCENSSDRMRALGDKLSRHNLAVIVAEKGMSAVGTMRLKRYVVSIYDPTSQAYDEIIRHVESVRLQKDEELSEEVLNALVKTHMPKASLCRRKRRANGKGGKRLAVGAHS